MELSRYNFDHRLECRKLKCWSRICIFGNMGALRRMSSVREVIAYDFGNLEGQKEQRSSEVKGASVRERASDWSRGGRLNLWRDLRPGVSAYL